MKYYYSYNPNVSFIGAFGVVYFVILIAITAFLIATMWKIFVKAGEPGWKSIIPFYSVYILYKISFGRAREYVAFLISTVVCIIATFVWGINTLAVFLYSFGNAKSAVVINGYNSSVLMMNISAAILCIAAVISFVIDIKQCVALSKAFGHGGAYAAGLIFFGIIFYPMLAFGNSEYVGPKNNRNNKMNEKEAIEKELEYFDF